MVTPHRAVAGLATDPSSAPETRDAPSKAWTPARSEGRPRRVMPLTRRYEVAYLAPSGDIDDFQRVAPATPVFEDAFASLARGTIVSTPQGPVAVEDLCPGMMVDTNDNGPQTLLWIGSITVFPDSAGLAALQSGETSRLTRLAADSFGLGRPMPDLVLAPRARLLHRSHGCVGLTGTDRAFAPARAFVDGVNVIEVAPVSPVRVFHLAFHGQQTVLANGVEVESYHPGLQAETMLDTEMRALFLTLFPHVSCFDDFGPMDIPRLTAFELESMRAA